MDVGRYYQKTQDFTAAMNRFQSVLINYPDSNQTPEAYYRLVACYKSLGMTQQATDVTQKLKEKFKNSVWTERAVKLTE